MKVLMVASEAVPWIQTGGLAEAVTGLTKALQKQDVEVRIILPKYGAIEEKYCEGIESVAHFSFPFGWRQAYCGIEKVQVDGVICYLIDNEYYFKRYAPIYGHGDDAERFAYFSHAVIQSLKHLEYQPDILHCHDWHTALVPFLLQHVYTEQATRYQTILTVHNFKYQGIFPATIQEDLLHLHPSQFRSETIEFYGQANYLKAGIVSADKITTVSPRYREESFDPYFAYGLEGILSRRSEDYIGIINGIDEDRYSPKKDTVIKKKLTQKQFTPYKDENRKALQQDVQLPQADVPVVAMVTRLREEKGIDLVRHIFHELMSEHIQWIILGDGDEHYEQFFQEVRSNYIDSFRFIPTYDEEMARKIYAGSDIFVMPSRFEPCGIAQLIALRYGSIPVVRDTGGLHNTVTAYDPNLQTGNGFTFQSYNAHDMLAQIKRAIQLFHQKHQWEQLLENAMQTEVGWKQSSKQYLHLYESTQKRSNVYV